jgi:tRNA 2-selenouridine synthase
VQATRLQIENFLQKASNGMLIDVRSPAEYKHAHIPGAASLPLFSDEERKLVGTAYKQLSREVAIKIGLDFFGPKMKPIVEAVEKMVRDWHATKENATSTKPGVYVYCWRGGMRSGAISWLLNLYGFDVYTLAGGYKAFRNRTLKIFETPIPIKILAGYTGSGKTELLQALATKGNHVIDLEGLAGHKGSAFGNLLLSPQPTQEMFENQLGCVLAKFVQKHGNENGVSADALPYIWFEDESQRIGNLNVPHTLWAQMRSAPIFFIDIPFEQRLKFIVSQYGIYNVIELQQATLRISKRLGGLETKNTMAYFEEGNITEAFRILLRYYDKQYSKGLHNRQNLSALLTTIQAETVSLSNAALLTNQYQPL